MLGRPSIRPNMLMVGYRSFKKRMLQILICVRGLVRLMSPKQRSSPPTKAPNRMAYYDALVAKWATLSGTTAAKLAAINAMTVPGPVAPSIVQSYKIYNAIVPSEFTALTAANQQLVRDILGMGVVDVSPGTSIRSRLLSIFPSGTATFTALASLAATFNTTIPWWQATVAQGGGGLSSPVTQADLDAVGGLV